MVNDRSFLSESSPEKELPAINGQKAAENLRKQLGFSDLAVVDIANQLAKLAENEESVTRDKLKELAEKITVTETDFGKTAEEIKQYYLVDLLDLAMAESVDEYKSEQANAVEKLQDNLEVKPEER